MYLVSEMESDSDLISFTQLCKVKSFASASKGQVFTACLVRGLKGLCSKMNKKPSGFKAAKAVFSRDGLCGGGTW